MHDLKSKNGFSLIEIIIALSLATLGALYLMRMQTEQAKNAATTKANIEIEALIGDLRGLLTRSEYCLSSFGNLSLPEGGEAQVVDIRNPQGKVSYAAGGKYGDQSLLLKEMKIMNFEADRPGGLSGLATFELTLERVKNSYGAKEIKRKIEIALTLDSSHKIIGCETVAASAVGLPGVNPKVNQKIVNKVLSGEAAENPEEEAAMKEATDAMEKNPALKEAMESYKSVKKLQEDMQKKQDEMEAQE